MADKPFSLADRIRLKQFSLLGRIRRLFQRQKQIRWTDTDGIPWAGVRVDGMGFAVSGLGANWCFDPFISQQRADKLAQRKELLRGSTADVNQSLDSAVGALQLGDRCERVLWSIHRALRRASRSVFRVPDISLAHDVYGDVNWPAHWRTDLLAVLKGLTYLHVAEWAAEAPPLFGTKTALLTLAADLRGRRDDRCDNDCPLHRQQEHHHFQVNVGHGFLGVLEELAGKNDATGIRTYDFFRSAKKEGPTIRQVGKTGRMVSVFLPAILGRSGTCFDLNSRQRNLLHSIVREATRARSHQEKSKKFPADLDVVKGNVLPNQSGNGFLRCPLLDETRRYVGFNGNKLRRGLGYLLTSPGGWIAKAGYKASTSTIQVSEIKAFIEDLAALSDRLSLKVVGLDPGSDSPWIGIDQLRTLCQPRGPQQIIERLHLRIYAEVGWEERWAVLFSGQPETRQDDGPPSLISQLQKLPLSQKQIATEVGVNPSLFSKLLRGRKRWPKAILERLRGFLDQRSPATDVAPASVTPDALIHLWTENGPTDAPESVSMLEFAYQCLERGWSVVPMLPDQKKPCVKWKPFQTRKPYIEELQFWFRRWPDAGIALVLGSFSGVFVIDVDGPDAHQALLQRLGEVPAAPLAVSGSRKPHRYHLYFRHPPLETKAKLTPWHTQLEFRGTGGLVVMPPSHKSGRRYAWAPGRSLDDIPLTEVPQAVLETLRTKTPIASGEPQVSNPVELSKMLPVDVAPSTQEFLEGRFADAHGWNGRLFKAACDMHAKGISHEQAEPLLLAGAKPWNQQEKEKALKTIASAFGQPRAPSLH